MRGGDRGYCPHAAEPSALRRGVDTVRVRCADDRDGGQVGHLRGSGVDPPGLASCPQGVDIRDAWYPGPRRGLQARAGPS
jgi:hypothetical protein